MFLLKSFKKLGFPLGSLRNQSKRLMSGHKVAVKDGADGIIIPHEKFEVGFARRQVGNNFVLIAGLTFFVLSFGFVYNSGVIVANWTPPKKNLGE